jgi:membrane carboxypeptidase/penicillin-binding protein
VIIEKSAVRAAANAEGRHGGRPRAAAIGAARLKPPGLSLHDVVLVRVIDAKGKSPRAELRVRPTVQGAAVVLRTRPGRILAMAGGFSYPLSQLNRATQSQRQPGSALKPLTYLAALQKGLQPNTYVRDEAITLPPISGEVNARPQDYYTPKNYDGGSSGIITLRRALEYSKNLATVNLLDGGVDSTPSLSLDRICALAQEAQIYKDCVRYYPFVLGAQPVRPVDLAAFYAAIANEGARPTPYAIESMELRGQTVYRHSPTLTQIGSADRVSFYQLKTMLQGVLQRGTARPIASMAPYVAGKTGTTDGENDAWFVGFTNDVTVAVWVGYDNADGKRRTLGSGQTGATVAIPVFQPIMEAVWAYHVPKAALAPPSPEARRNLVTRKVDMEASDDPANPPKSLVEYFRRDASGRVADTQYDLVSRGEVGQEPIATDGGPFEPLAPWGGRRDPQPPPRQQQRQQQQQQRGMEGWLFGWQQPQPPAPRYYDPRSPQRPQYDRYPRY